MGIILEYARTIFLVLLIVVPFRTFAYNQYYVPSGSMLPTLQLGDHVGVSMWAYGFGRYALPFDLPLWEGRFLAKSPERGDIAVFQHPRDSRIDLIKRIVAIPGDTIQMRNGQLYLNGEPTKVGDLPAGTLPKNWTSWAVGERYASEKIGEKEFVSADTDRLGFFDNSREFRVPPNTFFAVGDNRDNSNDSRAIGFISEDLLIGRAEIVLASRTNDAEIAKPWTWIPTFRMNRFFEDL